MSIGLGGAITPAVKGLIIANCAVYALQILTQRFGGGGIESLFALTPTLMREKMWLWQLVTYMFLHAPNWPFHLILNMLMLWMFGTEVERAWGSSRFLKYYFVCGLGAALATCLTFYKSTTYGASGAVFGVMLAFAMLFPERMIYFWFIFPMRAMSFVILCAAIELLQLLNLPDGVAHTAHLGGMLFGWLYLKRAWKVPDFVSELRWRWRRRRLRVIERDDRNDRDRRNYPYH
ncbi:MAG TPA: rhomboid family intramembrane serine protease [Candidatus Polarisedimenticolia bacterium]|jgi:membrane associated rhomboid family serine protease|nr:rhomboid family intramembrane serine protease [Candidatus Polarisedimenticolia bacterium]